MMRLSIAVKDIIDLLRNDDQWTYESRGAGHYALSHKTIHVAIVRLFRGDAPEIHLGNNIVLDKLPLRYRIPLNMAARKRKGLCRKVSESAGTTSLKYHFAREF